MIVDEVRRILAGQSPTEVRPEDQALVEGYRQAMEFVLRRADDAAFQWTRELIVALHHRALAGRYDAGAGRLRTDKPAFIVNRKSGEQVFLPPPGEAVAALWTRRARGWKRVSRIQRSPLDGSMSLWPRSTRFATATAGLHGCAPRWRCTGASSNVPS